MGPTNWGEAGGHRSKVEVKLKEVLIYLVCAPKKYVKKSPGHFPAIFKALSLVPNCHVEFTRINQAKASNMPAFFFLDFQYFSWLQTCIMWNEWFRNKCNFSRFHSSTVYPQCFLSIFTAQCSISLKWPRVEWVLIEYFAYGFWFWHIFTK